MNEEKKHAANASCTKYKRASQHANAGAHSFRCFTPCARASENDEHHARAPEQPQRCPRRRRMMKVEMHLQQQNHLAVTRPRKVLASTTGVHAREVRWRGRHGAEEEKSIILCCLLPLFTSLECSRRGGGGSISTSFILLPSACVLNASKHTHTSTHTQSTQRTQPA